MQSQKVILLALALIFAPLLSARADIYRYIDENGVMHFTNVPTSSKYRLYRGDRRGPGKYSTSKYDRYINRASSKFGVSFPLLKAMIKVESNFNPRAVSHKGAKGLMQIMPMNFKMLGIDDPFDPYQNIMGGAKYFKSLLDRFDGKVSWALAGYNAGPERVARNKGIPPIRETRQYVKKVIRHYRALKN